MKQRGRMRHFLRQMLSCLMALAMIVGTIQMPLTAGAADSAAESDNRVACYLFFKSDGENGMARMKDVALYYEIFDPADGQNYWASFQTATQIPCNQDGEYLLQLDANELKDGKLLWIGFQLPEGWYAGPVNHGAVNEMSFTSDYDEIQRNWNGAFMGGEYDFICSYDCSNIEYLFRNDYTGELDFMYCGKKAVTKHAVVMMELGENPDNPYSITPCDLNDNGKLSFTTPAYLQMNYKYYLTYTDAPAADSPYLVDQQEGRYTFKFKECIDQEFGGRKGYYMIAVYPMDADGTIQENTGESFYYGNMGPGFQEEITCTVVDGEREITLTATAGEDLKQQLMDLNLQKDGYTLIGWFMVPQDENGNTLCNQYGEPETVSCKFYEDQYIQETGKHQLGSAREWNLWAWEDAKLYPIWFSEDKGSNEFYEGATWRTYHSLMGFDLYGGRMECYWRTDPYCDENGQEVYNYNTQPAFVMDSSFFDVLAGSTRPLGEVLAKRNGCLIKEDTVPTPESASDLGTFEGWMIFSSSMISAEDGGTYLKYELEDNNNGRYYTTAEILAKSPKAYGKDIRFVAKWSNIKEEDYYANHGDGDFGFDCSIQANGGLISYEEIVDGQPVKRTDESISVGRPQEYTIAEAFEAKDLNIKDISREGYFFAGWDIYHYSFDFIECFETKQDEKNYQFLYGFCDENGKELFAYVKREKLDYNGELSQSVKTLEDLKKLGGEFNYLFIAKWDTKRETVVSDTESIIEDVNGTESRKVATQENSDVNVTGDTTVIPQGAVFTQKKEAADSENYQAVADAMKNSESKVLQAVENYQVMDFGLAQKTGETVHQLEKMVEVSLPVPADFTLGANHVLKVYRMEEDGTLTECQTTVADGRITFLTNHFSIYILAEVDPEIYDNPFADVEENQWYFPFVKFVNQRGMMNGKKMDGVLNFDPAGKLTRAEFVQTLYNMEQKPAVEYEACFADVPEGKWFTNAILWAKKNNIAAGKKGVFDVSGKITREEMATMLKNYAKFKGYNVEGTADLSQYVDVDSISSWATDNMKWAVEKGIMKGKKQGEGLALAPKSDATRAECATMLKNFCTVYNQ